MVAAEAELLGRAASRVTFDELASTGARLESWPLVWATPAAVSGALLCLEERLRFLPGLTPSGRGGGAATADILD